MRWTKGRTSGLPTVHLNGSEHFVDFNRLEFRLASNPLKRIDFESPAGRQSWDELMILECVRCGLVAVESRCSSGLRCERCGGGLLV